MCLCMILFFFDVEHALLIAQALFFQAHQTIGTEAKAQVGAAGHEQEGVIVILHASSPPI